MNLANDDTFNNNNNQENQSIPGPIQSEVTSKRHQKSKDQKEENKQSKKEKRLKFRKALDELREGRVLTVAVPRPMD